MERQCEQPFESIESAYDFLRILSESVAEAKRDIEGDIQRESSSKSPRRLDALRLACYSVDKLEFHINRSRRILNDLRSLRRLLFEERAASKVVVPSEPDTLIREVPVAPVPARFSSQVARLGGKGGSAAAA